MSNDFFVSGSDELAVHAVDEIRALASDQLVSVRGEPLCNDLVSLRVCALAPGQEPPRGALWSYVPAAEWLREYDSARADYAAP